MFLGCDLFSTGYFVRLISTIQYPEKYLKVSLQSELLEITPLFHVQCYVMVALLLFEYAAVENLFSQREWEFAPNCNGFIIYWMKNNSGAINFTLFQLI